MNRRRHWFAVCGLIVTVSVLSAQTPAQQRPPVFRSDANFVQVDAYPMRDGRIVHNLEKTDFEILEDGKPQTVEAFQFIKVEGRVPEAEKRDPNTQEEGNELAADPANRVFVVFLDQLGVSVDGAHRARRPLVDMLNRVMAATDLFGVMTQDMRPRDLVFGRKLQATEQMLAKYWPWGERESILERQEETDLRLCTTDPDTGKPFPVIDEGIQRDMLSALRDRRREDAVLTQLESLVDYLGAIRETRTSLIIFTEGWLLFGRNDSLVAPLAKFKNYNNAPMIGSVGGRPVISSSASMGSSAACFLEVQRLAALNDGPRFRDLERRAQRSNVAFYPVNPLGLVVFDSPINSDIALAPVAKQFDRVSVRRDTLLEAASQTGGIAVVDTNNLSAGLDRVAAQLEAYYVLGYYSTNTKFDGKYRQITVKLRVPGVSVTARKGYRAPTEAEMAARTAPKPLAAPGADAAAAELAAALGNLARVRSNADLYGLGVQTSASEITVFAEVSSALAASGRWMDGGDLEVVLTTPAGDPVGNGRGKLDPAFRGTSARVPIPAGTSGPWSARLKLRKDSESIETSIAIVPPSRPPIGPAMPYRSTSAVQSMLRPAADFIDRKSVV